MGSLDLYFHLVGHNGVGRWGGPEVHFREAQLLCVRGSVRQVQLTPLPLPHSLVSSHTFY
jgi:hypothetical protein